MAVDQPHYILGLLVLLLVDIIWVASSELSEYIFKDVGFDKPFFSTYTKTSLFTIYLFGFLVYSPWRQQCCSFAPTRYARIGENSTESDVDVGSEEDIDNSRLSSPHFEPVKMYDTDKSSDGETEDKSDHKSVRFKKLAEVRQMPESDGVEALLSRLSFSASLRAHQELYNFTAALPVRRVANLALGFCFLWFIGNYSYQVALSLSHSGVVNVVSSTSGLFTLILAAIFPSGPTDKFTVSKLMTVLLMLAGVSMISIEDIKQHQQQLLSEGISLSSLNGSGALAENSLFTQLLQQPLYHHSHRHLKKTRDVSYLVSQSLKPNHFEYLKVANNNPSAHMLAKRKLSYSINQRSNDVLKRAMNNPVFNDFGLSYSDTGDVYDDHYDSNYNSGTEFDTSKHAHLPEIAGNFSNLTESSSLNNLRYDNKVDAKNKDAWSFVSDSGFNESENSLAPKMYTVNESNNELKTLYESNTSVALDPQVTNNISGENYTDGKFDGQTAVSREANSNFRTSDSTVISSNSLAGVSWALCGAVLYACYMVFLKRRVGEHQHIDIPMFFGFVGLFNAVLLWPGLVLLHTSSWETFVLPTALQMLYIVGNGLVGTVLSELLWLWGAFLTSSLVATLSLSLTIPLSMAADVLLRGVHYSWLFYVGSLPILFSFVCVTVLTHYDNWDPVGQLLCCRRSANHTRQYSISDNDQESQSLIVSADQDTDGIVGALHGSDDEDEEEHYSAISLQTRHQQDDIVAVNTARNAVVGNNCSAVSQVEATRCSIQQETQDSHNVNISDIEATILRPKQEIVVVSNEVFESSLKRPGIIKSVYKSSVPEAKGQNDPPLINMEDEADRSLKDEKKASYQKFKDEAMQALMFSTEQCNSVLLQQGAAALSVDNGVLQSGAVAVSNSSCVVQQGAATNKSNDVNASRSSNSSAGFYYTLSNDMNIPFPSTTNTQFSSIEMYVKPSEAAESSKASSLLSLHSAELNRNINIREAKVVNSAPCVPINANLKAAPHSEVFYLNQFETSNRKTVHNADTATSPVSSIAMMQPLSVKLKDKTPIANNSAILQSNSVDSRVTLPIKGSSDNLSNFQRSAHFDKNIIINPIASDVTRHELLENKMNSAAEWLERFNSDKSISPASGLEHSNDVLDSRQPSVTSSGESFDTSSFVNCKTLCSQWNGNSAILLLNNDADNSDQYKELNKISGNVEFSIEQRFNSPKELSPPSLNCSSKYPVSSLSNYPTVSREHFQLADGRHVGYVLSARDSAILQDIEDEGEETLQIIRQEDGELLASQFVSSGSYRA